MLPTHVRAALLSLIATAFVGVVPALAQLGQPRARVEPLTATTAVRPGHEMRLAVRVTLPPNAHVQSNAPRDAALIPTVLTIDAPASGEVVEIVYPPAVDFEQVGQPLRLAVFPHEFVVGARVAVGAATPPGELLILGRIRYQSCDARTCYPPAVTDVSWTVAVSADAPVVSQHADVFDSLPLGATRGQGTAIAASPAPAAAALSTTDLGALDGVEILGSAGGYMDPDEFLRFVTAAERGTAQRGIFNGHGPFAILALVFVGGMALNLTPCVLPMIPVNLAIIGAGATSGSRRRGLALGSAYGSAMALVYGTVGVIVILTAGTFGTLNASPWFNAGIAIVFAILALAMFDRITIDFSRFARVRGASESRGSLTVAFTMGGLAALLAGACVAPVVIQVVLFASQLYGAGTSSALALPFVLGLGMALPWPIAGAGIAALPRPGAWMVKVKQVFGLLILATALYYGYTAATLVADRWVSPGAVAEAAQGKLDAGWHSSLNAGLTEARRTGKPVLIDLWATWCKNCLTMDAITFRDARVDTALEGYIKIKVQAEDPSDDYTNALMQRLGAVGLPTYVVARPAPASAGGQHRSTTGLDQHP